MSSIKIIGAVKAYNNGSKMQVPEAWKRMYHSDVSCTFDRSWLSFCIFMDFIQGEAMRYNVRRNHQQINVTDSVAVKEKFTSLPANV